MNIIPSSLNVFNTNVGLKTDFAVKYGKYASKYSHLDPLGNQKFDTTWPILAGIISIIATVVTFISSNPKKNPNIIYDSSDSSDTQEKIPERTPRQKFLQKLWWLLFIVSITFFIYAAFLYFKEYKPQYNSWLKDLPDEAKPSLGTISFIDSIQSSPYQKTY